MELEELEKQIRTLVDTSQEQGSYTIDFNANNLQSGIYFYRLKAASRIFIKKMMLIQ